jgi:hypothetical protein
MARKGGGNHLYLSKSLFIRGLQCHRSLYLQKYNPELKSPVTEEAQQLFDVGYNVGTLAQQLFPGGVTVPYEGLSYSEQQSMTQSLIEQGTDTIYEAAFSHNDVFVKADILHRRKRGWEIYEVKSSAAVKDYHYDDASVQYYVIAGTGLPVIKVFLVHVNTAYVRQGEIDVHQLFTIADLTETAQENATAIPGELRRQRAMLKGAKPDIDIGPHCNDPFECDFKGYCWAHLPSPSVFDLADRGKPDPFWLYERGIVKLEDVPPDSLGWRQKLQLDGLLHRKNHLDADAVRGFLESLRYPLCFMDFETTVMVPIPLYDGTRPYQQVPFQFSVHILPKPGGKLEHHQYLSDGAINPQKEFLKELLTVIPRNACILVWNQSFESSRLNELAAAFPKKTDAINHLIRRIRDLMAPFRDKSLYHWQFNGSYSIKAVLPALVPDLSYDKLNISDGGQASAEWLRMVQAKDNAAKAAIREQLLRYCELDTLAMVKILEKMQGMVSAK